MTGDHSVDGSPAVDQGQVEKPVWGRIDDEETGKVVQPGFVVSHHDVYLEHIPHLVLIVN